MKQIVMNNAMARGLEVMKINFKEKHIEP